MESIELKHSGKAASQLRQKPGILYMRTVWTTTCKPRTNRCQACHTGSHYLLWKQYGTS